MLNPLSKPEATSQIELAKQLLRVANLDRCADKLADDQRVYEMDDGGMGSFSFAAHRAVAYPAAKATYKDEDDVEVHITLYVDKSDLRR